MNEQLIKQLYANIGLDSEAIKARVSQAKMLGHQNEIGADSGSGGGIVMQGQMPLVAKDQAEVEALCIAAEGRGIVGDVDTFTFNLPSNGVPLPLLTIWTTQMIEEIFKVPTLAKLTTPWQQGTPGIQEIKIPVMGFNGNVDIYDDYSAAGNTSINTTWVNRQIAYFEQTMGWGTLQEAQFSLAKIPYVNKLREAMAINIAQFQNDLGFQGYTGIPDTNQPMLWGILNEPNLNPAIALPADGQIPGTLTPTTAWYGKDYSQIIRDIQLLVKQVLEQAKANATTEDRFILAIPPSAEAALLTSTPYGVTVKEQLRKMFPRIEFVITANFEADLVTTGEETGETVAMVLFEYKGQTPYRDVFVTKLQGHRPHTLPSAIIEKMSMALGGSMLPYPLFVSHAYGV